MTVEQIKNKILEEGCKIHVRNEQEQAAAYEFFKLIGFEDNENLKPNLHVDSFPYCGYNKNDKFCLNWYLENRNAGGKFYESLNEFLASLSAPSFKTVKINDDYSVEVYKDRLIVRGAEQVEMTKEEFEELIKEEGYNSLKEYIKEKQPVINYYNDKQKMEEAIEFLKVLGFPEFDFEERENYKSWKVVLISSGDIAFGSDYHLKNNPTFNSINSLLLNWPQKKEKSFKGYDFKYLDEKSVKFGCKTFPKTILEEIQKAFASFQS